MAILYMTPPRRPPTAPLTCRVQWTIRSSVCEGARPGWPSVAADWCCAAAAAEADAEAEEPCSALSTTESSRRRKAGRSRPSTSRAVAMGATSTPAASQSRSAAEMARGSQSAMAASTRTVSASTVSSTRRASANGWAGREGGGQVRRPAPFPPILQRTVHERRLVRDARRKVERRAQLRGVERADARREERLGALDAREQLGGTRNRVAHGWSRVPGELLLRRDGERGEELLLLRLVVARGLRGVRRVRRGRCGGCEACHRCPELQQRPAE